MTTIDFNKALADAKSASFEAMPNGDYNIEVVTAESVISSTGRPMLKCKFKVIDGPYTNRPVMTNIVLVIDNPNALSMFFRNMKAFGLDEAFFTQMGQMGSLEPVAGALLGRRAQVTLGTRQWQGEDRNEVTAYKKYTGAPGTMAGPGMPGMPGMPSPAGPTAPGPIANTPQQVMPQVAQNFNPATQPANPQAPQMPTPAPAAPTAQMTPQAAQPAPAPVPPPAAQPAVQAPVAPESMPDWLPAQAQANADQVNQQDPGSTAAQVSQQVADQVATPPVIPTAADTAPPAYAQPPVTQYVDSNAQSMPTPPAPPI